MSKNTLDQLTPEQQQIVISWIAADRDRKPGQPSAVTRVRNQFHIETTEHELQDYRFEWQLQHMLDDDNFKPENVGKLMTALAPMDQDRLQEKALSLLLSIAIKRVDFRLLQQATKICSKNKELDLKKTILLLQMKQSTVKSELETLEALASAGNSNLPIGSSPMPASPAPTSPLPLGSSPLAAQPLTQPLSAVFAARVAELEKTQGPLSEAAKAEIAQSILDDTLKSVKRLA